MTDNDFVLGARTILATGGQLAFAETGLACYASRKMSFQLKSAM
jgi:hypothetical protein